MNSWTPPKQLMKAVHMRWDCKQAVVALVWPLQWVSKQEWQVQLSAQKELKGGMTGKMLSSQDYLTWHKRGRGQDKM